eukprot:scaffold333_cov133-Cylindrotheca_fusiformis.AAC.7
MIPNRRSTRRPRIALLVLSAPLLSSAFTKESSIARLPACPLARTNRLAHLCPLMAFKKETDTTKLFYQAILSHNSDTTASSYVQPIRLDTRPPVEQQQNKQGSKTNSDEKVLKFTTKTAVAFGMLLAMTTGFVNGACLSGFWASSQATAAVTSTWTNSAVALASQQTGKFVLMVKYLLSFAAGSIMAGLLAPNPVPYQINNPKGVAMAFGLSSLTLGAAGLLASATGYAGTNFLCLCLIANGIQNSLTSSLTSNLCRTSHFSGMTSDIGTYIGQIIRGNRDNLMKLRAFSLLSLSFWLGGLISYPLSRLFDARILLLAAGVNGSLAASLGLYSYKAKQA